MSKAARSDLPANASLRAHLAVECRVRQQHPDRVSGWTDRAELTDQLGAGSRLPRSRTYFGDRTFRQKGRGFAWHFGPADDGRRNRRTCWLQPRASPQRGGDYARPAASVLRDLSGCLPLYPGRAERKLIVELGWQRRGFFYDDLSRAGFRRSHRFAYRPACRGCTACVPVRIAVDRFRRHPLDAAHPQRQSRPRRRSCRLPARRRSSSGCFRPISGPRHGDSEMATMSYARLPRHGRGQPGAHPRSPSSATTPGRLVAASLIDLLDDGVSAVYSFFDPHQRKRSLGTWSILWLVEECRRQRASLCLSRLLDRREPEDGLQGPLPGPRAADRRRDGSICAPRSSER